MIMLLFGMALLLQTHVLGRDTSNNPLAGVVLVLINLIAAVCILGVVTTRYIRDKIESEHLNQLRALSIEPTFEYTPEKFRFLIWVSLSCIFST